MASEEGQSGSPGGESGGGRWLGLDFDGTITRRDVLAGLVQEFARPGWQEWEERWRAGAISSWQCIRGQLAFLDLDRSAVESFAAGIEVDPGFAPFVAAALEQGLAVEVVSDGLDAYIEPILDRSLGAALRARLPVCCNRLRFEPGGLALEPRALPGPEPEEAVADAKAAVLRERRGRHERLAYFGDGLSDRGAARQADELYAKSELARWCRERGIAFQPCASFDQLRERLLGS